MKGSDEFPAEWLPLFEWHLKYHYDKQKLFVDAVKDYWEIVFLAGNGTGKTHILYWSLACLALGIHPRQIAKPPLHIKVLMNDFEHGYGKIFTETCLYEQYLPDGTVLAPMLRESPFMVTKWPSRDDKSLHFYNGSVMFFQTSEQKKKQHSGTNFDVLACDEEQNKQIYDESKRGLRRVAEEYFMPSRLHLMRKTNSEALRGLNLILLTLLKRATTPIRWLSRRQCTTTRPSQKILFVNFQRAKLRSR